MNSKYQEDFISSQSEVKEALSKVLSQLFSKRLAVEGQPVQIPKDADIEYKLKYTVDEDGGSLAIKIAWNNYDAEDSDQED